MKGSLAILVAEDLLVAVYQCDIYIIDCSIFRSNVVCYKIIHSASKITTCSLICCVVFSNLFCEHATNVHK
jgi:hypothetical protein